jgi:hypothetical protein
MDVATVGGVAVALIALAVLVETVTDIVKARLPMIPAGVAGYLWPLLAMALGVALAFWAQVGVSPILPIDSSVAVWADRLLAGLLIGGGASTIYDWLDHMKTP